MKRMRNLAAACIACLLIAIAMSIAIADQSRANASAAQPTILWVNYLYPATADNSSGQWLQPTIADGMVYVGALSAINFGLPLPYLISRHLIQITIGAIFMHLTFRTVL